MEKASSGSIEIHHFEFRLRGENQRSRFQFLPKHNSNNSKRILSMKTQTSIRKIMAKVKSTSWKELLVIIGLISIMQGGPAPRNKVALRAGYGSHKSSAFRTALGRLQKSGHLQDLQIQADHVMLTEEGCRAAIANAASCSLACTNEDVQKEILERLTPKMTCLFRLAADGQSYSRAYLAKALGYASMRDGGFQSLLCRMHRKGFLNLLNNSSVQLSDECFPFGRSNE